jgi:predicted chitinase
MAENMNGLGSKTKYEYPMAKAREGSKSIIDSLFDFVGYSDPIPEYQKSPQLSAEENELPKKFDGTSPLDDILPPLSRILEKFNSKLGAITTGYVKPTFSSEPLTASDASPLLSGTGVSSNDMPPLTPTEQAGVDVALAAQGNGLMRRPASDAAPIATESSELMVRPKIRPTDLSLEGLRSIEDGEYSFKAADYLKSKIAPSYEVDDSKLAITGNDFTDRDAALSEITKIAYKKYLPLQAAALLATAEAESSTSLVENPYYRRSSALSKLAGDSTERKAAIEAIYSDPAYLRKGSVPGSDDALVNTAGAKKLFNIAYDDQYRSTNSKLGNDKVGDGYKYRGRGLIQITGKYNYAKYGKAIGVGDALVKNPELLLTDPKVMAAVTIAYLDDKDFANKATSEEGLRSVIVHDNSKDEKGVKPSTKRWERTLEIAKAAATKDVTSKLAERTKRPNSNQGF